MARMKHSGKAAGAALRIIWWTLVLLLAILAAGVVARYFAAAVTEIASFLVGAWVLFALFTFYFFRDPEPTLPADAKAIVAPAHGKVDVIDETAEPKVMGGPCRRISIFLSVMDVHVQRAPASGKVTLLEHRPGQFLSATKAHCAECNESVLLGLETSAFAGQKLGLRLIAGLIARRIVPWVAVGELVNRGERISLIQFGSRVELFLPMTAKIQVELGAKVKGGETVVATLS
jgi:phosphatidylserine decarboxylase